MPAHREAHSKPSADVTRIRKIEREDLDQLFALDKVCFRPGIAYSKADLNYFIRHPRSLSFAAVDSFEKLAGFAIAESHLEKGVRIGHIVTIDVAPDARRKGIGRQLMLAMIDGLTAIHAVAIRLEVAVDNPDAQSFYQRFGFARTGRIAGFYMGSLDALTMEKPLGQRTAQRPEGDAAE
jgi:ribosomal-protein-alanine N-acetyltransferase